MVRPDDLIGFTSRERRCIAWVVTVLAVLLAKVAFLVLVRFALVERAG